MSFMHDPHVWDTRANESHEIAWSFPDNFSVSGRERKDKKGKFVPNETLQIGVQTGEVHWEKLRL